MTEGQVVRYLVPEYNGAYTSADIRWIVDRDLEVSVKAGVDPLVVIAQMDHETAHLSSYWSQRPRRNPAGIGVTARRGRECLSPLVRLGRRPRGQAAGLRAPQGRVHGRAEELVARALSWRPLPDSYRGTARTIYGLQGRWATDRYYAAKLARVGDAIDATR